MYKYVVGGVFVNHNEDYDSVSDDCVEILALFQNTWRGNMIIAKFKYTIRCIEPGSIEQWRVQ